MLIICLQTGGHMSNGNEGVLHIPQSYRIATLSDAVLCQTQETLGVIGILETI